MLRPLTPMPAAVHTTPIHRSDIMKRAIRVLPTGQLSDETKEAQMDDCKKSRKLLTQIIKTYLLRQIYWIC
jgi:hypothetical protein